MTTTDPPDQHSVEPASEEDELHALLDKMIALRQDPRPKSERAEVALKLATKLLNDAVGWANRYLAGRAAAKGDSEVDDAHEDLGQRVLQPKGEYFRREGGTVVDWVSVRLVLAELLWHGAVPPFLLRGSLAEALRALNEGEVQPIMQPVKTKGHGAPYTWAQQRLKAVRWVAYTMALEALSRDEATERVADAYGVSADAIRNWRLRDLLRHFNKKQIKQAEDKADRLGKLVRNGHQLPTLGWEGVPFQRGLIAAGEEYKSMLRLHKSKCPRL